MKKRVVIKKKMNLTCVMVSLVTACTTFPKNSVPSPRSQVTPAATVKKTTYPPKTTPPSKEKIKEKKAQPKSLKSEPLQSNQEILESVSSELKIKKNTSVNMAGNGDKQEICFVKIDTLEIPNKGPKLEITLSEMVDGKEISLQFSLFFNSNTEAPASQVISSNIKPNFIQIEQNEKKAESFHLHKKLNVEVSEAAKKTNFIIEELTTHTKKQCSIPFPKAE